MAGGTSQDRVNEEVRPLRQQQLKGGQGGGVGEGRLDQDTCKLPMTQIQNQGEKLPKRIIPPATVHSCLVTGAGGQEESKRPLQGPKDAAYSPPPPAEGFDFGRRE